MTLFSRIDRIDWATLSHAYGPADDVPGLVRGLVSPLAEEREAALDGMFGAVHHQGDVYDSTVAVLPFLFEALATPTAPGRAEVLSLIGSIAASASAIVRAGGERGFALPGQEAEEAEAVRRRVGRATEALVLVRAGDPALLAAIVDRDPSVRRQAPEAALASGADAAEATLRAQLTCETDLEARRRQVRALAVLLGRAPARAQELEAWLSALATNDADPAVRVDALTRLLERPTPPSEALLAQARRAVFSLYGHPSPATATPSAGTDTLTGAVRALRAQEAEGRRAPDAGESVHRVSRALGPRVEARAGLLLELLSADDWEPQLDALGPLAVLMANWRGDYRAIVARLGERLVDGRPRLQPRVAKLLQDLFHLAAPAGDALAEAVRRARREGAPVNEGLPPWVVRWPGDGQRTCGETVVALARAGDARALPAFTWMLEQDELPRDVGFALAPLKEAAAPLAPRLAETLAAAVRADPSGRHPAVAGLLYALAELGPAAAPAVDALIRLVPHDEFAARTLGKIGPTASAAVPALKKRLSGADPALAVAAASALSRIAPHAAPLAPVFARHLAQWGAAAGLSRLGPAARRYVKHVQALFEHRPVEAAGALWRITGAVQLGALEAAWRADPLQRAEVAALLEELGPAAASMARLVEEELAQVRRHNASEDSWSSHQVDDDERLLEACRGALARLRPSGSA